MPEPSGSEGVPTGTSFCTPQLCTNCKTEESIREDWCRDCLEQSFYEKSDRDYDHFTKN